ncbi:MAG: AAC(3) family N-acetyltransferase, partial [Candidatus Bipolaricaulia bacterium]
MSEPEGLLQRPLVTRGRLVEDLRRLGLFSSQVVMLHASVRAIGWVVGGPDMVIQAILEVLG